LYTPYNTYLNCSIEAIVGLISTNKTFSFIIAATFIVLKLFGKERKFNQENNEFCPECPVGVRQPTGSVLYRPFQKDQLKLKN
jgi:hypothetical protein